MKPKRTILCVDEDERSLSIRKVMLETRGYRVITCSNPEGAVEVMKTGGVDLVLADLIAPRLGGTRLVDQLKAISPAVPAIMFAGASGASSDDAPADVLLSKTSCSAAQLLDHIRIALVRKRGPKPAIPSALAQGSRYVS
jgi:CheY-like chemotaxis protein